jgi:hypothetical protein
VIHAGIIAFDQLVIEQEGQLLLRAGVVGTQLAGHLFSGPVLAVVGLQQKKDFQLRNGGEVLVQKLADRILC